MLLWIKKHKKLCFKECGLAYSHTNKVAILLCVIPGNKMTSGKYILSVEAVHACLTSVKADVNALTTWSIECTLCLDSEADANMFGCFVSVIDGLSGSAVHPGSHGTCNCQKSGGYTKKDP